MRKHLTHISVALLTAGLAVACGGRTSSVRNDSRDQTGGKRGQNERVALRGCIQPATEGGQGYALRHVVVVPSAEQPQGQETMEHPLIVRGSWVRLAGGTDITEDLKSHVNNEVTITGDVVDTGRNTIGTSGKSGTPQEQNPATSSVANGQPPQIAVEKITKIADNCAGE